MGSLFRSQEMALCQLYLQKEAAYTAVSELGELGVIQFKDLNEDVNSFQRKYVNEVRRCEEMERQLRFFEKELNAEMIPPDECLNIPPAPGESELVNFEATFESLETQLREISNNIEVLARNYYELLEMRHVLRLSQEFLFEDDQQLIRDPANDLTIGVEMFDMAGYDTPRVRLEFITGVIPMERLEPFMRILWLSSRGMIYVRHTEVPEDIHEIDMPRDYFSHWADDVRKVVFTVFFHGEQLRSRVRKICDGFHAAIYPCPPTAADRQEMLHGVKTRIADLEIVIRQSREQRRRVLETIACNLVNWTMKIFKVKAIFHTLNMLHAEKHSFIAEGWCPVDMMDSIQEALVRATEQSHTSAPSLIHRLECNKMPTFHRTNKFTQAFQSIIDAYGMASYMEVNPAPFAIITFPFLFSVMFGDAGHGVLMSLAAGWMLLKERSLLRSKSDNEIWNILFSGRYIIFLMGLFSIYSGLLYNDTFSKSFTTFPSSWNSNYDNSTLFDSNEQTIQLDPNTSAFSGKPYPFGLDPVWQMSSNKITMSNSFKKKLSVIFGVFQMVFGVILSLANHIHFKRWLEIVAEFVPQLLFLTSIFGYLVVLIFVKWVVFTPAESDCAPSLLIGLIDMAMFKKPGPHDACALQMWYPGQFAVQVSLLLMALLCVPWMLLTKPLFLWWRHRRATKSQVFRGIPNAFSTLSNEFDSSFEMVYMVDVNPDKHLFGESSSDTQVLTESSPSVSAHGEPDSPATGAEFDLGEAMILQMIHTIEFCLGCISHTASYLRLWALSLAHAQLSEVLWDMVFRMGFKVEGYGGMVFIFLLFAPWACLTVAILLVMEGLSAFLHTLRLHWVEFQSKFYKGEGFRFEPFNFTEIINQVNF